MFFTHVESVVDEGKERRENLGASNPTKPQVDHEVSFAFCRGKRSFSTAQHCYGPSRWTCFKGVQMFLPNDRKTSCDVKRYRRHSLRCERRLKLLFNILTNRTAPSQPQRRCLSEPAAIFAGTGRRSGVDEELTSSPYLNNNLDAFC